MTVRELEAGSGDVEVEGEDLVMGPVAVWSLGKSGEWTLLEEAEEEVAVDIVVAARENGCGARDMLCGDNDTVKPSIDRGFAFEIC